MILQPDSAAVPSPPLPPLVVVVGQWARQPRQLERLLGEGAVVLMASTPEAAQAWISHTTGATPSEFEHQEPVHFGGLEIDREEHLARWNGNPLPLTEREIGLLTALAEPSGRACSFGELTTRGWNEPYLGHHDPLRSAIKRLRKKLDAAGARLSIESVPGFGFRLTEPST